MYKKILAILFVLAGLFALSSVSSSQAQSPTSPTADPTIVMLQQTLEALSAKIAILEEQQSINKQWYELEIMKVMIPIASMAVVLAAVGIASPYFITQQIRSQFEKRLNLAIYRADPTFLPIHIPMNGFDVERERMKWMGFKNLKPYIGLTSAQTEGIIVYPINSLDDLTVLGEFIQTHQEKEKQMAFVVYTQKIVPGANEFVGKLFNATLANSSVAMVTHIYALARGLKN